MSNAGLEVRMQSGKVFYFMADVAEEVYRKLQSDSALPIVTPFGPAYSHHPIEVTMIPKYVECYKWFPHGRP